VTFGWCNLLISLVVVLNSNQSVEFISGNFDPIRRKETTCMRYRKHHRKSK